MNEVSEVDDPSCSAEPEYASNFPESGILSNCWDADFDASEID